MSRTLTLARFSKSADGVIGRLVDSAGIMPRLYTIEEEDRGNARRVSCIPPGKYTCKRTTYHRHGIPTFEVTGVPDRDRILFHVANTEEDVEGCIGLGLRAGEVKRADEDDGKVRMKKGVLQSKPAFAAFMRALDGIDAFEIEIVEAYG